MRELVVNALGGLADLIFPPLCEHCAHRAVTRTPLCWRCMRNLERVTAEDASDTIEAFLVDTRGIGLHCQWYFDRKGPLRDVIHALKYKNRPWYGLFLGRELAETIGPANTTTIVIPLPLHTLRRLERGYNQAEWIARGVARTLDLPLVADLLTRPVHTGTQTELKRDDRWKNVRDVFSVSGPAPGSCLHTLLIDDVVTTGATALSAAMTLREAGVETVTIASVGLARA